MTERSHILEQAKSIIASDRNVDYGEPEDNFTRIADMWTAYLGGRSILFAHDVAAMQILLKVARTATSPGKEDNWVDIAGYAACGGEVRPASAPIVGPIDSGHRIDVIPKPEGPKSLSSMLSQPVV